MNYLDDIAENFSTLNGLDRYTNEYEYRTLRKYFHGTNILELGCADGGMTRLLIDDFEGITVVDGSTLAINRLNKDIKSPKIKTIVSFFEDIEIDEKFDIIIMGHILEHVDNPTYILSKFKNNLKYDGKIMITVPNAMSLHRIAAVKMGLLTSVYDLNETDLRIGHKRVYDFERLKLDIESSGLRISNRDGYWLKFLSNKQIENTWTDELIRTYMDIGCEFIENAAEIVAICTR